MTNNRWGFNDGYNSTPATPPKEIPQITPRVIVDKTAVQAANKTVNVLETVLNDVKIENERLKRDNAVLSNQNSTLNDRLNQANSRVQQLEMTISNQTARAENFYTAQIPAIAVKNPASEIYAPAVKAPTPSINHSIAAAYSAPVNPMTVFVEFLEELTILEDYIKIADENGVDFQLLCNQYSPSDYIDAVCTDYDGDLLEGWDEANELWLTICDTDSLDDKEAYIE